MTRSGWFSSLEKPNDRVRHQLAQDAMNLAGAKLIKFAISYPCFEFWLFLHFEYSTAPESCCDDMLQKVRKHYPRYEKGQELDIDYDRRVPIAVKHAEMVATYHNLAAGANKIGNPSTGLHVLVRSPQLCNESPFPPSVRRTEGRWMR